MIKIKDINHVRLYRKSIAVVTNNKVWFRMLVNPDDIKFLIHDLKVHIPKVQMEKVIESKIVNKKK